MAWTEEKNRSEAWKRMRDKRARGECRSCPGPTEPGKSRCRGCRKRHQESQKKWRAHSADSETRLTPADMRLAAAGRCDRCHLLKPCVCLPTIQEIAVSRAGESSCIGPAHASHSGNAKGGSRMP